ncbi:MAG: iron-containing alcohol dehydrogenase [Anaerolineae bacterium]
MWDEPYDPAIAARTQKAIDTVQQHAEEIGRASEDGVRALMDALIESGLCMLDFGASRPASGAEHHSSHYWEMKRLQEGRETPLHGAQVGYALTLVAEQYDRIRHIDRAELMNRLESAALPDRESEIEAIQSGYGAMSDTIIKDHGAFLDLTEDAYDKLKHRIADNWDNIQAIAAQVPAPEAIKASLDKAGGPSTWQALNVEANEVQPGFQFGHYLRNRFTVLKLSKVLGVPLG